MLCSLVGQISSFQCLDLEGHWVPMVILHLLDFSLPCVNIQPRNLSIPYVVFLSLLLSFFYLCFFTILCRNVFDMRDSLEPWPHHLWFHTFTMARRSPCTPFESRSCCERTACTHGICRRYLEASVSISYQCFGFFFQALLLASFSHRHKGRWIIWTSTLA